MKNVELTEHALKRLVEIERLSVTTFGDLVAGRYIKDLEAAINRLAENPGLGKIRPDYSARYSHYAVRRHYIVYEVIDACLYIVSIEHQHRDMPKLLRDLEPFFAAQVDALKSNGK